MGSSSYDTSCASSLPALPGSPPSSCSTTLKCTARPSRPRRCRKKSHRRRSDYVLRTLSLNVRSLRQIGSIELIVRYLRAHGIGCAALQETWLQGQDTAEIDGFTVIRNNSEGVAGMRGGVAIVLDRDCTRAWDAAGNARCMPSHRVLAVRLKFEHTNGSSSNVCFVSGYAPIGAADAAEHARFRDDLDTAIDFAHEKDILIIAADLNASLGICARGEQWDEEGSDSSRILGPHGIAHVNAAGRAVRTLMHMHRLCAATSFFKNEPRAEGAREEKWPGHRRRTTPAAEERFRTWSHPRSRRGHQLDHILVRQSQRHRLSAAHIVRAGLRAGSDHRAVRATVQLGPRLKPHPKKPAAPQRGLLRNPSVRARFVDRVKELKRARAGFTSFKDADAVFSAVAAEVLIAKKARRPKAWFGNFEDEILAGAKQRDAAMERVERASGARLDRERKKLSRARKALRRSIRRARSAWVTDLVDRIAFVCKGGAPFGPADCWQRINELKGGPSDSKPRDTVPMRKADGSLTSSEEERGEVFTTHFGKVYNQPRSFDNNVLDELPQRKTLPELEATPSRVEVVKAFRHARDGKAAGPSGVPIEYWKVLMDDAEMVDELFDLVTRVWTTLDVPESWFHGLLKELPKKPPLDDPNCWRGITLLDTASKCVSFIISNRLQKALAVHGRESQCGFLPGRSTVDGIYILKTALQLRRESGLPTWVCFVDLSKAFDTVDREAMLAVMGKFGVPPHLLKLIGALYREANVSLQIGDSPVPFATTRGVKQGCPMSPVIFDFMIDAWFTTSLAKMTVQPLTFRTDDTVAQFGSSGNFSNLRGRSVSGPARGTEFEVSESLYADDAAVMFRSRADMQAAMRVLDAEGKRWGMLVHAADRPTRKSKTEFMCFPPPKHHPDFDASAYDVSPCEIGQDRWIKEARLKVDGVDIVAFKYLGSVIAPSLRDDIDVENRISQAAKAFGALCKPIFKEPGLTARAKGTIYSAFVLSLLLYGSEAWALTKELQHQLSVFHNNCIRRIAGINRRMQWHDHVTSEAAAARVGLRTIESHLDERLLRWAGHVARLRENRLVRCMLFAWSPRDDGGKRAVGAPQTTAAIRLHKLLGEVERSPSLPESIVLHDNKEESRTVQLKDMFKRARVPIQTPLDAGSRAGEAAAALRRGHNPYCLYQCAAGCRARLRSAGIQRCKQRRCAGHLTCTEHKGEPALFGPLRIEFGVESGADAICAAQVKTTGLRCTHKRRVGFLTCGTHKRAPATFDANGGAPQSHRGWADIAVERDAWKFIIKSYCGIPDKKARKKACPLSRDQRDHGKWPTYDTSILDDEVVAWTDGSGLDNGKPFAKAGFGIFFGVDSESNVSQPLLPDEQQTNNRGEMKAILVTLRLREPDLKAQRPVRVVTDSGYSIGSFGDTGRKCRGRGWRNSKNKPAANIDLIKLALAWRRAYGNLFTLEHVYSHTNKTDANSVGNDHADRLAVAGASHVGPPPPMLIPVNPGAAPGAERARRVARWAQGPDRASNGFKLARSSTTDTNDQPHSAL